MTIDSDTQVTASLDEFENTAGSDLAYLIEPLTPSDWALINQKLERRFSGVFVSRVNGKALPWRGTHHLAALSLFELDPTIDAFEVMPERMSLTLGSKRYSFIPAFRIRSGHSVMMVDVLHAGQEAQPHRARLTAAINTAYSSVGLRYRTIPERDVLAQPRLRNARFVLGYRGFDPVGETEMAVVKVLSQPGAHTVNSVIAAAAAHPDVRDTLFSPGHPATGEGRPLGGHTRRNDYHLADLEGPVMSSALGRSTVKLLLDPEQAITFGGEVWTFRGRASDRERRLMFDRKDGLVRDFSDRELLKFQSEGKLRFLSLAEKEAFARKHPGNRPRETLDTCDKANKERGLWIRAYVRGWEQAGRPPRTPTGLTPVIADVAREMKDHTAMSVRSLQRFITLSEATGGDPRGVRQADGQPGQLRQSSQPQCLRVAG